MSLAVGSRVGQYEIAEAIGAGGMGVVFSAAIMCSGATSPSKSLPPEVAEDSDRRQRFAREAVSSKQSPGFNPSVGSGATFPKERRR